MARHSRFLVGLGNVSGDPHTPGISTEAVVEMLRRLTVELPLTQGDVR
jgi:hypothetical protein